MFKLTPGVLIDQLVEHSNEDVIKNALSHFEILGKNILE